MSHDDALLRAIRLIVREEIANTNASANGAGDDFPGIALPIVGGIDKGGFIYFIRSRAPGTPIKIGHTKDVARRLHNLQMGSPHELVLVAMWRVDEPAKAEALIHERFDGHRIRGEWFAPCGDLLALIDRLQRDQFSWIAA